MKFKKWQLGNVNQNEVADIAQKYKLSPLVATVLLSRGFQEQTIADFLFQKDTFSDPFLFADMELAMERTQEAIENGELICVFGDYDCDGVTSTAVLYRYLESAGANVMYYIPDRHKEGYGLNNKAVEKLAEQGTQLIITVDNGISAVDQVDFANQLGVDVIITDHHKPGEQLPKAVAVVNPHRKDCNSTFKELAGVGVAFKFVCAMEDNQVQEVLDFFADLVAVGTIADVMPLVGENRLLVQYGLKLLENTENLGLQGLKKLTGLDDKETLSAQDIAFLIAPRINAAGRIDKATRALSLLLSEDEEEALVLAADLFEINENRKEEENQAVVTLAKVLEQDRTLKHQRVLTFVKEGLHQGVIGIVSARILEKLQKPVLIITNDEESGLYKGSARSVDGFSIKEALDYCKELLTMYGGHEKAAGFSLKKENLTTFCEKINAYAKEKFVTMPAGKVLIDATVTLDELSLENVKSINVLEPLGEGNLEPTFLLKKAAVTGIYPMSQGKHTRVRVQQGQIQQYVNFFKAKTSEFPYQTGQELDLVVQVKPNLYNGVESVSFTSVDARLSGLPNEIDEQEALYTKAKENIILNQEELEKIIPSREDFGVIYKAVSKNMQDTGNLDYFYIQYCKQTMEYSKFLLALRILTEEKLLQLVKKDNKVVLTPVPVHNKINLEETQILKNLRENKCVWGLCI